MSCMCLSSTNGCENLSKAQTALEARCLTLRVIRLTVSHSHTDGEAEWHNDMFIEKLWIIEKVVAAAGMSQPLTKKHGHEILSRHTRAHTRAHTTLREGENLQQCTGQDGNHSFYKLIST